MKRLACLAAGAGVLLAGAARAQNAPPAPTAAELQEQTVLHAAPRELFRDYALAACLSAALPQISAQASAAANGYLQYGDAPVEAYEQATVAARVFLKRPYVSQTGADLSIMKCIDFTHSQGLDALVTKYLPAAKTP